MFPAFISLYDNYVYFFPGSDSSGKQMYAKLNINTDLSFNTNINDDGSIKYVFNKNLSSINCKLIPVSDEYAEKNICIKI